jgi:glycosyltransferase involved in cell wall biosynthesis
MKSPFISIVIPARNEEDRLISTIRSFSETRSTHQLPIEFVIVDDVSEDGCCNNLHCDASSVSIRVIRSTQRLGVPAARNLGVKQAAGEIIFITDAHVRISQNWDLHILKHIQENRILAATIIDPNSAFKGYGCSLLVPFMGTLWNTTLDPLTPIQIAACPGTILYKRLFEAIAGYDSGMILYGAAEPEFSIRAWLSGAEILALPQVEVSHRFKSQEERDLFLSEVNVFLLHNSIRFGLLYLNESTSLQMIRYHSLRFPEQIREALKMIESSDVWERKTFLEKALQYNLNWLIQKFGIVDEAGSPIIGVEPRYV